MCLTVRHFQTGIAVAGNRGKAGSRSADKPLGGFGFELVLPGFTGPNPGWASVGLAVMRGLVGTGRPAQGLS